MYRLTMDLFFIVEDYSAALFEKFYPSEYKSMITFVIKSK